MRVHHLNCLTMCPPVARLIDGRGSWFSRGEMVCHVLLIATDSHGLVLVDTAIGLDDCAAPSARLGPLFPTLMGIAQPPPERTAIRQIEALGFHARDVQHIVLTHLDLDHAGGLPDFPHAKVHVLAAEKEAALARRSLHDKNRYRPCQIAHGPRWVTYPPDGERWRGFEAVRGLEGLPTEILLVPLSGHTRGHACVAVEVGGATGTLVHCGDAYFHRAAIDSSLGGIPIGLRVFEKHIAAEPEKIASNHARLRELAAQEGVRVFCAHDPAEWRDALLRSGSSRA